MLGEPTDDEMKLYSDIVYSDGHFIDYISGASMDGVVPGSGTNALTGTNTTYLNNVTQQDWEDGDWFLFGMTFLPWFPMPADPNNPGGYIRRNNASYETKFNKARVAVLIPTGITVAKIAGVSLGAYYGSKLAYRMYKKR